MLPVSENREAPPHSIDPSPRLTVTIGLALALICALVYLYRPDFIQTLQFKVTDSIVAGAPAPPITDKVAVVEIDEPSLEAWGQWPWPRRRLADLLDRIDAAGARAIALDFVMAEPERSVYESGPQSPASAPAGMRAQPVGTTTGQNHRSLWAETLARGPFVLGYVFHFSTVGRQQKQCHLHPLELVTIDQPSGGPEDLKLYEAQDVVCNLDHLARAAPQSGFLNGQPDSDGRLRRLPLMISYRQAVYPSLALAALLVDGDQQVTTPVKQIAGSQCLVAGSHTIPVDQNGNLRIRFTSQQSQLRHLSAGTILSGETPVSDLNDCVVVVGLNATGLSNTQQTPGNGRFTAVDIHAQAIETILAQAFIRCHKSIVFAEVILAILLGGLFSLSIARLAFVPTTMLGAAGIAGFWGTAQLLFNSRQILISPLLPTATILATGLILLLFKYWIRQRRARHSMQDALVLMKSSEQNLNAIIKSIPDIVFRLDTTGRITFISPALAKYKIQPQEMIGKHILDLVVPEDRDMATWRINERRTGKRATTNLEMRLTLASENDDANETERFFSVSAEGIYTQATPDTNSFAGTQGIARDIDQRKELERKLEHSKKMEAMGSLAAGVAHDLNNILSGLVSYPELLLLDLPADSPIRAKIETIQHSGQRAADIVQDMLMIARRNIKNHAIITVNEAVESYLEAPEYHHLSENHPQLQLKTELADDLMNIKGSSVHIQKAIMNLVGNAVEAMPAGGTVKIRTRNRYLDMAMQGYERIPEGEYVVLSIIDEGVGISAQELPRIFEPFYSKKRMGSSGSGLGMTVVWHTIKDHEGFVNIETTEGDGACFDLYLPATREKDSQTERRIVLQDYTGSETILVVDDIADQLDIAVRMLGKLGYQVAGVSGGEEAIAYLQSHTADLIVLDMVMPPGMDGLDTYRHILEIRPDQKAIITSGYAPSERVQAMQDLGAGTYIRKPYTMEKIGIAVRAELDRP